MSSTETAAPVVIAYPAAVECAAYRERHGYTSLQLYLGPGGSYVCKHVDNDGVVMVDLHSHTETKVSAEEFKVKFFMLLMDESVYWFGTPAQKETADRELQTYLAATRFCIEQDRPRLTLTA